jgi:flagella basal body P-ring formation protein FlgA
MNHFKTLALFAALAVPALGQPLIDIASTAVTAGNLAGEVSIFAQADPAATVARAPAPGVSRRVARDELLRWASSLGLDPAPEQLPDELILRRAMRLLTHAEIEQAASSAIAADEVSIKLLSARMPSVPAGEIEMECLCNRLALNKPTPLRIRWREPDGRTGMELVQAVIVVSGQWYEAAASLDAGTALTRSDVLERHGPLPELNTYLTAQQLDGRWTLMRTIKAGQPLTRDLVRSIPLISRGDLVELRYEVGGIRLRSPGRAEASGSTGDLIPFHNVATGGRVSARLVDQETAFVEAAHAVR